MTSDPRDPSDGPGHGPGHGPTPAQTVGPFLAIVLPWPDGPDVAPDGADGAVTISGVLRDGAGEPVTDGLVETWQAGPGGVQGFGRCPTDGEGRYRIRTRKPPASGDEAPHLDVSVFARGLLDRVVTRLYFPDEAAANAADPVLTSVPGHRRDLLVAHPDGAGALRFDIALQGASETPFFRF